MHRAKQLLFSAVLLVFSAAALVCSLIFTARAAACEDKSEKATTEIAELKKENLLLRAKCDNRLTLAELEKYAVEQLGMERLTPAMIETLEVSEELGVRS